MLWKSYARPSRDMGKDSDEDILADLAEAEVDDFECVGKPEADGQEL